MSSFEDVPANLSHFTGRVPCRVEPKSVYTNENGEIYHAVKLHGVYKDATGWHIKEEEPRTEFINYGDRWKGSSYYGKRGILRKTKPIIQGLEAEFSEVKSTRKGLIF